MTPQPPDMTKDGPDWNPVGFGKNQPEYQTLPAAINPDGVVVTEWRPTAEELARLMDGHPVRVVFLTFNKPLYPVKVGVP